LQPADVGIAKPLLILVTIVGVAFGLYEAWLFAGGLVFLMLAMLGVIAVAMATVISTIRRERERDKQK
jgi:hypothetical protein